MLFHKSVFIFPPERANSPNFSILLNKIPTKQLNEHSVAYSNVRNGSILQLAVLKLEFVLSERLLRNIRGINAVALLSIEISSRYLGNYDFKTLRIGVFDCVL